MMFSFPKLNILGRGHYQDYLGGPYVITRIFGRRRQENQRFEDAMLPALKRKGPRAKECRQLLEAGKGKELDFPLGLPEGTGPAYSQ